MQIVIDIDDEQVLFDIKNQGFEAESETDKVIINALYNGTPLPKGHGRLIDADRLEDTISRLNSKGNDQITRYEYKIIDNVIFEMPTIIKADKESD